MKELIESIQRDQNQLTELNWRSMAGGALLAASLLAGSPGDADAKTTKHHHHHTSVTQAEQKIDLDKLLDAIKQVESSDGTNITPRHEPGVEKQLRKKFRHLNKNVQGAIEKYGYSAIATSYGPYQLLASTCYNMGYQGEVEALKQDSVSKEWAKKYVQQLRNSSRTKKVEDIISAYNAGLGGIGKNPNYVRQVMHHYKQ